MSLKNIQFKSHKSESDDDEMKIKKSIADQLRGQIDILIQKQDKAKSEAWKSVEEHERYKAKGKPF